ncbi:AAA family ATPase [Arenivirga flava]|uniref:Adenylate kinase n=1 Tax=Arenivirga flava TaxID=1930060 RepID=A0AA37XDH0_9MICO|nr:AAA family ATPase [Arenivirga flava]GMA29687.1 adenylate kinase [Arenivirga flava]
MSGAGTASGADPFAGALGRIRSPRPRIVLVDGAAGSGKSTLAERIAHAIPRAQLLALDDLYPGWDGLDAAARTVADDVLRPYRRGGRPRYRRWDWTLAAHAETRVLDRTRPLVVEGCGSFGAGAAALADLRVWVETRDHERRRRLHERDGDAFGPFWPLWEAQFARYAGRERPRTAADLVVRT